MNLLDYFRTLRRGLPVIIATTLIGLAVAGIVILATPPTYMSTAKVLVASPTSAAAASTDLQQQIASYVELATTPPVLDPVISQLRLDTTAQKLADHVTAYSSGQTVLMDIAASASDARQSARIANAVASSLSRYVTAQLGSGSSGGTDAQQSQTTLSTVQSAVAPMRPTSPDVPFTLALGLVLGLALGAGIVVVRAMTDTRVWSAADVRAASDVPVLGVLGRDGDRRVRTRLVGAARSGAEAVRRVRARDSRPASLGDFIATVRGGDVEEVLASPIPTAERAEAVRALRTRLTRVRGRELKRLVVTSPRGEAAATTTVTDLGVALVQLGSSVLLIDGDLRSPGLAAHLGLHEGPGLSDVLSGATGFDAALQRWGDDGLSVLPAGEVPPNPSELLGSTAMTRLLARAGSRFDVVIIDAPPVLPVTDAVVLADAAGTVLVLAPAGRTRAADLDAAVRSLRSVDADVLGVVVTLVPDGDRRA